MTEPLDLPRWRPLAVPGIGPGVALEVDGADVWFASADVDLAPAPEAAACLLAYPCLLGDRPLRVPAGTLDDGFVHNLRQATDLMAGWWGHGPLRILESPADGGPRAPAPPGGGSTPGTALFFSGGIDSFFSLLKAPGVGALVFLDGFDVRLGKPAVADAMSMTHQRVAAERGIRFLRVTTNLREHPVLGRLRWPRYHGAPLAAAAHLLGRAASRFVISSSYPVTNLMPWGSHPDLDPLWGSSAVTIGHFGHDHSRAEKLVALADKPLVHRELRVCYPPSVAGANCGRCEKCVRTRLTYRLALPQVPCTALPDEPDLAAALAALKPLWPRTLLEDYRQLLGLATAEDASTVALRALIGRSEAARA